MKYYTDFVSAYLLTEYDKKISVTTSNQCATLASLRSLLTLEKWRPRFRAVYNMCGFGGHHVMFKM